MIKCKKINDKWSLEIENIKNENKTKISVYRGFVLEGTMCPLPYDKEYIILSEEKGEIVKSYLQIIIDLSDYCDADAKSKKIWICKEDFKKRGRITRKMIWDQHIKAVDSVIGHLSDIFSSGGYFN